MAGFFENLQKGRVGKAFDTAGNGALKIAGNVTKVGGDMAENTLGAFLSPIKGVGAFISSPMMPLVLVVGGIGALYILSKR